MTSEHPPLAVVIMSAGKGTRMRSSLAKVLHLLAGRPLLEHVFATIRPLAPQRVVAVIGHQAEAVQSVCDAHGVDTVRQEPQLGTGHAVAQAEPLLAEFPGDIVVLSGDVPLLQAATVQALWQEHQRQHAAVTMLTALLDDATGYGRIVRNTAGQVQGIVEECDATEAQQAIREINSGIYCFKASFLFPALCCVGRSNAQDEQYLTDVVGIAVAAGHSVAQVTVADPHELLGVNTRMDLAHLEAIVRQRTCAAWMQAGVTIVDPATTYIDILVQIGQDTVLAPHTHILGQSVIGKHCRIGPHVVIQNSVLEENVQVEPLSFLRDTTVPAGHIVPALSRYSAAG
jgi:bifunctional UDP-N-acetylglucosamine pyrophosphorylase / glucosamine-1-phosphate N-acetyltransferase